MPKSLYEIKNFSGGLNCYADSRDISDEEFSQNWNIIVDKSGILRVVGSAIEYVDSSLIDNANLQKGYGLFTLDTDYPFNAIDGTFNNGFEEGTIVSGASSTQFVIESTSLPIGLLNLK